MSKNARIITPKEMSELINRERIRMGQPVFEKTRSATQKEISEWIKMGQLGIEQHDMMASSIRQHKIGQQGMRQPETEKPGTTRYVPREPWVDYPEADRCIHLLYTILLERPVSMDHFSDSFSANPSASYQEEERLMQRRQGMLLKGTTNSGKTRILLKFKEKVQEKSGDEITVGAYKQKISLHPVIYVSTPPSKMQFLFKDILKQLNAPCQERVSQDELLEKVIHSLIESEVRMLILDEFQNVLEGEKGNLPLLMKILLHISNKAGVSLVLAGTPNIDVTISTHDPLRNRLMLFETSTWSSNKSFQDFLMAIGESRNLICNPPLHSSTMAGRIFKMTEGIIGEVSNVLFRLSALSDNGFINEETLFQIEKDWLKPSERRKTP